ncbi:hypothetical protein RR48_00449 [Papilio machaon]|uniref:Uncharacterized protein n=1 Tax=Papilio machaon TaxID=76193 RepID=A0A0N1IJX0_PAPMA|nr:hypothetical protein RR48_00449 [Papilio machaon]
METEAIDALQSGKDEEEGIKITSTGPVKAALEDEMQVDEDESTLLPKKVTIRSKLEKGDKKKGKKKTIPKCR